MSLGHHFTVDAHVAEYFDGRAADYDKQEFHQQIAARVAASYQPSRCDRLLDIGTGTGLVLRHLLRDAIVHSAVGIDISREMITRARRVASQAHFIVGDAHDLPFRSGAFEAVFCANSLMYFHDPLRAIFEASRVCCERGLVTLATFQRGGIPSQRFLIMAAAEMGVRIHDPSGRWSDPNELASDARKFGLTEVSQSVLIFPDTRPNPLAGWDSFVKSPFGRTLRGLRPRLSDELRDRYLAKYSDSRRADVTQLDRHLILFIGRKVQHG